MNVGDKFLWKGPKDNPVEMEIIDVKAESIVYLWKDMSTLEEGEAVASIKMWDGWESDGFLTDLFAATKTIESKQHLCHCELYIVINTGCKCGGV